MVGTMYAHAFGWGSNLTTSNTTDFCRGKKERLFSGLFYRKEVDSMVTPIHRSPVYVIKGFKLLLFIFQACFFLFIYLFFGLFVNLVITAIYCLVPE